MHTLDIAFDQARFWDTGVAVQNVDTVQNVEG